MCFKRRTAFLCGHTTIREGFCDEVASHPVLQGESSCQHLDTTVEQVAQLCGTAGYYCKEHADGARMERVYQDLDHYEKLGQYHNTRLADLEKIHQNIVANYHQFLALDQPLTPANNDILQESMKIVIDQHTKIYNDKRSTDWVIRQLKLKATTGEQHFKLTVPTARFNRQEPPSLLFPPDEPDPVLITSPLAGLSMLFDVATSNQSTKPSGSNQQGIVHSDTGVTTAQASNDRSLVLLNTGIDLAQEHDAVSADDLQHDSIFGEDKTDHSPVGEEHGSMLGGHIGIKKEQCSNTSVQYNAIGVQDAATSTHTASRMPPPAIPASSVIPGAARTFPVAALTGNPAIAQITIDPATGDRSTGVKGLLDAELAGIHQMTEEVLKRNPKEEVKAKRKMSKTPKKPKSSARSKVVDISSDADGSTIIKASNAKKAISISNATSGRPKRKLKSINYSEVAPDSIRLIEDDVMSIGSVHAANNGQVFNAAPSLVVTLKTSAATNSPSYTTSSNDTVQNSGSLSDYDNTASHDLLHARQYAHTQVTNACTPSPYHPYVSATTPHSLNGRNGSSCRSSLNIGHHSVHPMIALQVYNQKLNHAGCQVLPSSPHSGVQSPNEQQFYVYTPGHGGTKSYLSERTARPIHW